VKNCEYIGATRNPYYVHKKNMIQLPNNFTTDIASSTNSNLSAFSSFATLIIGVLLATIVLTVLIGAVKHHN
jgi:hypothetical protein